MSNQPSIDPWLREIIVCPQCKGPLTDGDAGGAGSDDGADAADAPAVTSFDCATCRLSYPIEGRVPVLLVDLATPLPA